MPDIGPYTFDVTGGGKMSYDSDFDIVTGSSSKTGAVIAIHGSSRTASTYFSNAKLARSRAGKDADYEVVAPQFLTADDVADYTIDPEYLWWVSGDGGWRHGGVSLHGTYNGVNSSSFAIVDQIINHLIACMPNLTHINVTGNSAGGGFCARYPMMKGNRPIPLKFIPWNFAGMWLRVERPSRNRDGTYYTPNGDFSHNNYPYGLNNIENNPYFPDEATIRTNTENSEIVYGTGSDDADPMDSDIGKSGSGMYQGTTRMERGDWYYQHMREEFPTAAHYRCIANNVEHDFSKCIATPNGMHFVFTPPGSGDFNG